jgi:PilZ domain
MKLINRRKNPRIEIKLRCYVAAPATRVRSAMRTENMSRNGLLIAWKSEAGAVPTPAIGQIVTVEIELPAHHGFSPKCIHCQGPATRVSNDPNATTVALHLNYMEFRSLQGQLFSFAASGSRPGSVNP